MVSLSFYWQCDRKYKEDSLLSTDTVGQLRGIISQRLIDDYDLEESPDVKLISEGVVLGTEDDRTPLQNFAITNGSIVMALSVLVAETNSERKKITSMKEVLEDLQSGAKSAEETAAALKDAQPFDLCCPTIDLGELGEGIPVLFEFICLLILVLLGLFVVHMPSLVLFSLGDGLDQWTEVQSNETIPYWYVTAANLGPEGSSSMVFGVVAIIAGIFMLIAGAIMSQRIRRLRNLVDQTELDSSDFGLFIEGLPDDLVDADVLKTWCETNLRPGRPPTEIVHVVIGYNMIEFMRDKAEFIGLKRLIAECQDPTEKANLQQRYMEFNKTFNDEKAFFAKLGGSGAAVVICRYSKDQNEIINLWGSCQEKLARFCECCTGGIPSLSKMPQYDDHMISVTRAPLPSDMLWENLGVSFEEKWKARGKNWAKMFAIFVVGFVFILGGRLLQLFFPGHAYLLIFAGLAIGFTTVALFLISKHTVTQERYETKTRQDFSLVFKFSVTYLMNYNIALLLASFPVGVEWYAARGLVVTISTILIFTSILYPIFYATGCKVYCSRRLKVYFAGSAQTQAALNKAYEPSEIDTARVYAQIMKIYYLALFYTPIFPMGALIGALGLLAFYWSIKKHIVQDCKRPYRQSAVLGYFAMKMYFFGVFLYGISQWYLLSYSLEGEGEALSSTACTVLILASLAFIIVHRQVYQTLLCTFLCIPTGEAADHGDVDYYDAQKALAKHMKYHTSHDVYLWLENIYAAKKAKFGAKFTPPWDLKTGNFTKPGEVASDASTDVVAPKPGALGLSDDTATDPVPITSEGGSKTEDDDEEPLPSPPDGATAALAEADPAELALEELKYKIPLAFVGGDVAGDGSDDDVVSESEAEADPGPGAALLAADGRGALKPGMTATIVGLDHPTLGEKYNGTICTVIRYDDGSGKWLCEMHDGKEAHLPASKLTPAAPSLAPGKKMLIEGLEKGKQFNGTVCTIVSFDEAKKAYLVELYTGQKVNIKPWNLKEDDEVLDLS